MEKIALFSKMKAVALVQIKNVPIYIFRSRLPFHIYMQSRTAINCRNELNILRILHFPPPTK